MPKLIKGKDKRNWSPPKKGGKFKGCSIGKDDKGVYIYTHRCRSKSYPSLDKIPSKVIKWIESTG